MGYFFYNEVPDTLTVFIGMVLIVLSGIYIVYREQQKKKNIVSQFYFEKYALNFFHVETSTKQAETTNIAPIYSLKPIISFVRSAAEKKPTATSKAKRILIRPGSNTSTLK